MQSFFFLPFPQVAESASAACQETTGAGVGGEFGNFAALY